MDINPTNHQPEVPADHQQPNTYQAPAPASAWPPVEPVLPPAPAVPSFAQPSVLPPQAVVSYSEPEPVGAPQPSSFTPAPAQPQFTDAFQQPLQTVNEPLNPQPVVQVLSPRGVEYVFLTIALFTGTVGLISALISLANGQFGFDVLSFPVSLLLVAVPMFAWLFLRLKNAELRDPTLALDASKRRSTQLIQIIMFIVCFFTLIGFVGSILAKMSGNFDTSFGKIILDVLSILVVAGGILLYYWRDEHKGR